MTKDQLWELIHRLSPSEKAYFKKNSKLHSAGSSYIYLKLFDEINSLFIYDEKKFKLILKKYRQSSRLKNYLYELILNSLESYATKNDITLQTKKLINYAKILLQKGGKEKSKKIIDKAMKIAVENFDYQSQIEILTFKRKIYRVELNLEKVRLLINQELLIFDILREIYEFETLALVLSEFSFKSGNILNKKQLNELKEFASNKLLADASSCKSAVATAHFYAIWSIYYIIIKDPKKSYKYSLLRLKFGEKTNYFKVDIQSNINVLNNLIELSIILNKYEDVARLMQKLKEIKAKSEYLESRKLIRYTIQNLHFLLASNNPFDLKELSAISKLCLESNSNLIRIDERIEIIFSMTTLCFNNNLYKEAKRWLKLFFEEPVSNFRIELQCYLHIINLYLHNLTMDLEYVSHLLKKTNKFLKDKGIVDGQEVLLSEFIKLQLSHTFNKNDLQREMLLFKNKIESHNKKTNNISLGKYIIYPIVKHEQ
jgi:hypothetical protein